jgi:hypothetical protein
VHVHDYTFLTYERVGAGLHGEQSMAIRRRELVGKDGGEPKIVPLNLVLDYPVAWSRYKVLRDLLQNFYDAVGFRAWRERFSYSHRGGVLSLRASEVGFSHDWLVPIGASTKRERPGEYAGYFGEGFKIASLCAIRDHGWRIEMASRMWELEVVVQDTTIDGCQVPSLAYHLWTRPRPREDTVLALYPFSDAGILESALASFFYPENPLFGDEIWSDSSAAVYRRSCRPKPRSFPETRDNQGHGVIYAGYQAVGSIPFPLIIADHRFRLHDRERNDFYSMDVVKVITHVSRRVSPGCAFEMLEVFKRRWYCYPRKKYDFECWHPIIGGLTRRLSEDSVQTQRWREKHPKLLVASQVKRCDVVAFNRRRQALDWLCDQRPPYRLVQDGFSRLGYPRLEEACERDGGFVQIREPDGREAVRIGLLESLVEQILPGFFGEGSLPPCRIITSDQSVWRGLANCIRLTQPRLTSWGRKTYCRQPYVALKQRLLIEGGFHEALSTYLHELAHVFGGDQSQRFSNALTEILQCTIRHTREIQEAAAEWERIK